MTQTGSATTGTSRFERAELTADEVELVGPLKRVIESGLVRPRVSQYYFDEPLFDQYEATTVRATWDFAATEAVVADGHRVLDLGCGDGRLLLHLAEVRDLAPSVGVDISDIAIGRFRESLDQRLSTTVTAVVGDIFDLPDAAAGTGYDVVTLGDATINFVIDDDKLVELFAVARAALADTSSRVVVAGFADGTPERLAFMDGRTTVVPFRADGGTSHLIWWSYSLDSAAAVLRRSAFTQTGWTSTGEIDAVVCDLRDRMWTPSVIAPLARRAGLEIESVQRSEVQDGAAVGMDTAVTIFRPA
jgi:SAM-dependent methyltransferase